MRKKEEYVHDPEELRKVFGISSDHEDVSETCSFFHAEVTDSIDPDDAQDVFDAMQQRAHTSAHVVEDEAEIGEEDTRY